MRRFLIAEKNDVESAAARFRAMLEWRCGVWPRLLASDRSQIVGRLKRLRSLVPMSPLIGFSADAGLPMYCVRIGNVGEAADQFTAEDVETDAILHAEWYNHTVFPEATARVNETDQLIDKEICIVDVGGMGLGLVKNIHLFWTMQGTISKHYPERARTIYVCNTPRAFAAIWALLKPVVPLRTQRKVSILAGGPEQAEALATHFADGIAGVPDFLGGSCDSSLLLSNGNPAVFAKMDQWFADL